MKNYYKILNIQKTTSNEDIKKAYRQAALFWHPDKNKSANAHEMFIEVNEAYNILIDSEKRKVYDYLYDTHFNRKQDVAIFKETKKEYQSYKQWVNFERIKAEKLAKISSDEILTDTFHFIDKYGWLILLIILGVFMLFALSIKK
jgi:DnaJ-class molecular chaperone